MSAVLEVRNFSRRYGPVVALDDVSIEVRPREILGLIGQNGSGKSTLLKILAGVERQDAGSVVMAGEAVDIRSTLDAARVGIGMVFQEQSLIENLTVAENIFLGKPTAGLKNGWFDWKTLYKDAQRQLDKIESTVSPAAKVSDLGFSQKQMVELAKVLALEEMNDNPLVVLFDEPTSVMSAPDIKVLFNQIRRLSQRSSVVFVSHRMDEVLEISDRVYVMSNGRCVAEQVASESHSDELYRLMVGHEIVTGQRPASVTRDASPRLSIQGLGFLGAYRDVSLDLAPGEIVGLCGVQGSGAEMLCRSLFGIHSPVEGAVRLDGQPYRADGPSEAAQRGVGYVPAERKVEGIVQGRSLHENIALTFWRQVASGPLPNRGRERGRVANWMGRLKVKAPSAEVPIDGLSGGNQQKIVIARWLFSDDMKVLVLDRPTRGLDPGAKGDLYAEFRRLAADGLSILFIADTLDEAFTLASTIVTMRDGEISGRFDNTAAEPPKPEQVVAAMV